jgi:hypothetical protein
MTAVNGGVVVVSDGVHWVSMGGKALGSGCGFKIVRRPLSVARCFLQLTTDDWQRTTNAPDLELPYEVDRQRSVDGATPLCFDLLA